MLFYDEADFDQSKFNIDARLYAPTYKYYYEQYHYLLDKLVTLCRRRYLLNATARGTLFLARHAIELLLKSNITDIRLTHNIDQLLSELGIDTNSILYSNINLDFNSEGDSLKYYFDSSGTRFLNSDTKVDLTKILVEYNEALTELQYFKKIDVANNYSRAEVCNLTFCLNETKNDNHIAHEYEQLVDRIFRFVSTGQININQCFLPVYFLIRHSIEISLKSLIREAREFSDAVKKKKIDLEHSLVGLLNVYSDYLDKTDAAALSNVLQDQLHDYRMKAEEFIDVLHELDSDSMRFRFPTDQNNTPYQLNISKYLFWDLLIILKDINVFLKFTNHVLAESNAHVNQKDVEC
ncbi:hypothetical protein AAKU52_001190 [Pedobacter sp. CG_S7]|uniref:hypothetical protein n=1 Tax=Pedobacter sp. CG_S7 TaxID=3143930 RepID=UPI00339589E7